MVKGAIVFQNDHRNIFFPSSCSLRFTFAIIVICGLSQPKLLQEFQNLHIKILFKGLLRKAWISSMSSLLSNILNWKLETKQYAG